MPLLCTLASLGPHPGGCHGSHEAMNLPHLAAGTLSPSPLRSLSCLLTKTAPWALRNPTSGETPSSGAVDKTETLRTRFRGTPCLLPSAGLAKAPGRRAWLEKDELLRWSALMKAPGICFWKYREKEY